MELSSWMHSPDDIDQTLTRSWLTDAIYSPLLSQHTDCTSVLWPWDYKSSTSGSRLLKTLLVCPEKKSFTTPTRRRRKKCMSRSYNLYQQYAKEFEMCACAGCKWRKCSKGTFQTKIEDMLVFKDRTCSVYFFPCVSMSNMETTFSAAAAKNCPTWGWNRTWALPPCTKKAELDKSTSY